MRRLLIRNDGSGYREVRNEGVTATGSVVVYHPDAEVPEKEEVVWGEERGEEWVVDSDNSKTFVDLGAALRTGQKKVNVLGIVVDATDAPSENHATEARSETRTWRRSVTLSDARGNLARVDAFANKKDRLPDALIGVVLRARRLEAKGEAFKGPTFASYSAFFGEDARHCGSETATPPSARVLEAVVALHEKAADVVLDYLDACRGTDVRVVADGVIECLCEDAARGEPVEFETPDDRGWHKRRFATASGFAPGDVVAAVLITGTGFIKRATPAALEWEARHPVVDLTRARVLTMTGPEGVRACRARVVDVIPSLDHGFRKRGGAWFFALTLKDEAASIQVLVDRTVPGLNPEGATDRQVHNTLQAWKRCPPSRFVLLLARNPLEHNRLRFFLQAIIFAEQPALRETTTKTPTKTKRPRVSSLLTTLSSVSSRDDDAAAAPAVLTPRAAADPQSSVGSIRASPSSTPPLAAAPPRPTSAPGSLIAYSRREEKEEEEEEGRGSVLQKKRRLSVFGRLFS